MMLKVSLVTLAQIQLSLTGVQEEEVGSPTSVTCQHGFAPSILQISYPSSPCEPCLETGVAYPGNNINALPEYSVDSVQDCQVLCSKEENCYYWTFDGNNKWCYLKSDKNRSRTLKNNRYTSGLDSILCLQLDETNEIIDTEHESDDEVDDGIETTESVESDRSARVSSFSSSSRTPILSVYHESGYRTVLTALPATFGMKIDNETEISGFINNTNSKYCQPQQRISSDFIPIAVVLRGDCKFSKKVENAAIDGYKAVIIVDTETDTNVDRISGVSSPWTDQIPVIFLLFNEAKILEELLEDNPNRTATISDSSTFSWFKKSTTTTSSTTTTTASTTLSTTSIKNELAKTFFNKFSSRFNVKNNYNQLSSLPGLRNKAENANVMMILEKEDVKGITEFTPLTIGSIIVGIVVSILLIISVLTLIVSKVRRQSRRRSQHTRCQAAIRQFDAMNRSMAMDNSGYSPDSDGASKNVSTKLPKTTYNLLECPVCLEIAWPPKKIFQCREGHIVCDTCKANPNLKTCPMCRIPLSSNLTSRNRSLEELARALQEEEDVSYMLDTSSHRPVVVPTAPPPDVVSHIIEDENSNTPEEAADTNQLIDDSDPDALRIISSETIPAAHLVVNLPPDNN